MNKLIMLIPNMRVRTKLMIVLLLLIVIPLIVFWYIVYINNSKVLQYQTKNYSDQIFNTASKNLDREFFNMMNVSNIVVYDNLIYDVASQKMTDDYTLYKQYNDYKKILDFFSNMKRGTDIDKIKLYLENDFIYSKGNNTIYNIDEIRNELWYQQLNNSKQNRLWYPPIHLGDNTSSGFAYISKIYSTENYDKELAILSVEISKERILSYLINATSTKNCDVWISDGENTLLSNRELNSNITNNIEFSVIKQQPENNWFTTTIASQKVMIKYKSINNTAWYLISAISYDDILEPSYKIRNSMIILILLITIAAYFIAYVISKSSTKRLSILANEMNKVKDGNLNINLVKSGNDEIGELMQHFNEMVSRISSLIETKVKLGQSIKSAELKALQSQINPHFLYNTLNLINCSAIESNYDAIRKMVIALSKFYKLTLSKGSDIVSIKDELAHITFYVEIQNMRFENNISFIFDIDDRLYNYSIIKITLQPLIENSILHGILEKESKTGSIKLTGRLEEEVIQFTIEDDGVGMSEEVISNILLTSESNDHYGYGTRNVNDRIKLYYGEKYGLSFTSVLHIGTKVTITLPAILYNSTY